MLVMYVCVLCVCMYECMHVHVRMYIIIIIIIILNNNIIYICKYVCRSWTPPAFLEGGGGGGGASIGQGGRHLTAAYYGR